MDFVLILFFCCVFSSSERYSTISFWPWFTSFFIIYQHFWDGNLNKFWFIRSFKMQPNLDWWQEIFISKLLIRASWLQAQQFEDKNQIVAIFVKFSAFETETNVEKKSSVENIRIRKIRTNWKKNICKFS